MTVWERAQSFRREHETYTAYSVGCAIVWALICGMLKVVATQETQDRILTVMSGWWMGWLSATIARAGYPPPKRRWFNRDTADLP